MVMESHGKVMEFHFQMSVGTLVAFFKFARLLKFSDLFFILPKHPRKFGGFFCLLAKIELDHLACNKF